VVARSFAGARFARADDRVEFMKVYLGSLGQMRANMPECPSCALFVGVIEAQGASYHDATGRRSLDCEDVYFRADPDLSYYGLIMAQGGSEQTFFVLKRLNITAHHVRSPETSIAYFDHILQVCRPGEIGTPVGDGSPRPDVSRLVFGGRIRPHKLDIRLVKRWISICQEEHGSSCHLETGPRYCSTISKNSDPSRHC
jgi:hypothetical protein